MADQNLNILLIDDDPERAAVLEEGLVDAGYTRVMSIRPTDNLAGRVQALEPDVVLIDLENPDRDTLENMFQMSRQVSRPIAMFVDQSGSDMIHAAIEAGVSAYVVDGMKKERVSPVLNLAISRFNAVDQLRRERDQARQSLEDRKLMDRAKGLLMDRKGMSESEAYATLRKAAMQQNKKISDIAQSVITAFALDI